MGNYKFFKDIISKIEDLQGTLNQLRDTVKAKIQECTPPKDPDTIARTKA